MVNGCLMIKEKLFLRAQARCSSFERLRRLRLFLDCPTELPAIGLFDSQSKAVLLDLSRLPPPGLKIAQSSSLQG